MKKRYEKITPKQAFNNTGFLSCSEPERINFNRYGDKMDDESISMAFAYILQSDNHGNVYYIVTHNGAPYDPLSANRKLPASEYKYRKVNRDAFDFYMMYLKTNNKVYFIKANREYINA